jgi:hypothetical protein
MRIDKASGTKTSFIRASISKTGQVYYTFTTMLNNSTGTYEKRGIDTEALILHTQSGRMWMRM